MTARENGKKNISAASEDTSDEKKKTLKRKSVEDAEGKGREGNKRSRSTSLTFDE